MYIKLLVLKYSWTLTLKNVYHKVEYGLSPAEHLSTKVNRDGEERLTVKKKKKIIYQLSRLKQKKLNFKYDTDKFLFKEGYDEYISFLSWIFYNPCIVHQLKQMIHLLILFWLIH